MGLSLSEYRKMKADNMIGWDTEALSAAAKNISDHVNAVGDQSSFKGTKWNRKEFEEQRKKTQELRGQLQYLKSYADSIKDSDAPTYQRLMEQHSELSRQLDLTGQWFDENREGFAREKLWQAAGQMKAEQTEYNALREIMAGKSTAEAAQQYGLDEKHLQESYQNLRAAQKQEDREKKYGRSNYNSLLSALRRGADAQIVEDVNTTLREMKPDERLSRDENNRAAFESVGKRYGRSAEEIKALFESSKEVQGYSKIDSNAISNDDKQYLIRQIIDKGTTEQLEQLQKELPQSGYYADLRSQLSRAIEEKNERRYVLDAMEKDPQVAEALQEIRNIDAHLPAYAASTGRTVTLPSYAGNWGAATQAADGKQYGNIMAAQEAKAKLMAELAEKGYQADKMVMYYNRYMEHREAEEQNQAWRDFASQNEATAAIASVASVPINMVGSLMDVLRYAGAKIDKELGGEGYLDPTVTNNYTANTIRETVGEMVQENPESLRRLAALLLPTGTAPGDMLRDKLVGNVPEETRAYLSQLVYSTKMSMGDMGLAAAVNAIPVAGQFISGAMFFSSAGVNAANEVLENGGTLDQATATMIAQGAAELICEKISLEQLDMFKAKGNVKGLKDVLLNTLKATFTEGSEEFMTTLANTVTDRMINGDNSAFMRSYREYVNSGMSEEEAKKKAMQEWMQGIVGDFLGGALSGAVLGGTVSSINGVRGGVRTNVGKLEVTVAEMTDLMGESNGEAVKTAEKIVKSKGVDAVLEAAKDSSDAKIQKTAEHFAELNEQGKLEKKDAAQLLVKMAKEQETINAVDALAGDAGVETLTDFRNRRGAVEEYNRAYDLSGRRIAEGQEQATGSFGESHPNGMAATDKNGKQIVVTGIESSLPEYGGQGRTVSLLTDSGEVVDAAGVTLAETDYQRLLNLAENYDTLGARALLYNLASAGESGMTLDDYIGAFQTLYETGLSGVSFDTARSSLAYRHVIRGMGEQAAQAAVEAGNADRDLDMRAKSHFAKRVRVPGKALGKSSVKMEPDVKITLNDDAATVLQAIAQKTGKSIVLTNALSDENRGVYSGNTIYLNANQAEHVMVATALHEAVHNMAVYAAEDFRVLQKFVSNYLVSQGKDLQNELADLAAVYGSDAPTESALTEELVCKTVESLAADRDALETALGLKENSSILEKVGEILQRIADRVMAFFKGDKEKGILGHNQWAQTFLEDAQALRDMAEMVHKGFVDARENERRYRGDDRQGRESSGRGNDITGPKSKDDTILDDIDDEEMIFTSDGDLSFDEYGSDAGRAINVEQLMQEQGADQAVYTLYNAAARTTERTIRSYDGVRMSAKNYERIARGVMKRFGISEKHNPEMVPVIADRAKEFVNDVRRGKKADFNTILNALAADCRKYLEHSGEYTRGAYQEDASKLYATLRGATLLLTPYAEEEVLDRYDGDIRRLRQQLRGYVNVGYERDRERYKRPIYIDDVIDTFAQDTGDGYDGISPYFPNGERPDSLEGWIWLTDMLELFKPKFVSRFQNDFYYESMDAAAVDMAFAISTAITDEKAQHAAATRDIDKKTIKQLSEERKRALEEQKALSRAKEQLAAQQYERMKQRYQNENMKRIQAEEDVSILKMMAADDARNYRRQYRERQRKNNAIRQLGRKLSSLTKRLDGKANKNEYIPETLKQPILQVLQMFDVTPAKGTELPQYFGAFRQLGEVSDRLKALEDKYEELRGKKNFGEKDYLSVDINGLAFDEQVLEQLKGVRKMISGKNVYQMTADELEMLLEVMNDLDHQLKEAVEIIVDGKKQMIREFSQTAIGETESVKYSKDGKKWVTDTLLQARNKFLTTHLDPLRFARMLSGYHDDAVLYKAMLDLHRGDQKRVRIMQQAYAPVQTVIAKYKRKELEAVQRKAVEEFTMKDRRTGADVKLSQGMLLSVYLTNLQKDGHRHLCNERYHHYTRVADLDYQNKNRFLPDIKGNHTRSQTDLSHEVVFSEGDLKRIADYVERTPLLKELAGAIRGVLNGQLADEINAVSMQRYGKMIATVQNYFPLRTDDYDPGKKYENAFEGENIFTDSRLKSRGFTKQRVFSENALVIDDALSVFQRHVNETAEYCGFLIPVENLKKIYNSGSDDILLSKVIENKFGNNARHYLNKLLGDIQERKRTVDDNLLTRMTGHFMGAALFANPRSALKNWGAMPLANRYFGTANVARATAAGLWRGDKLVEKYNDYTPYMWYRAQGNGTVVGELSRQHGLYGKITDRLDIMSWADQKVVNSLLYAAEQHVKQEGKYEFDSEEFKREVARQFERCVDESQPNSMITSKPQFVRNEKMRVLSLNAFASQRMAMGNCLMDSFMEYEARRHEYQQDRSDRNRKAKNQAKKRFAQTALGVFESAALQSLLGVLASVLVYHKWDDYKDERGDVTLESFGKGFALNTLKGIPGELAGAFAWADKLYSVIEKMIDKDAYGPDFSVMSISAAQDLYDAVKNGDWQKAWGSFADMIGMPAFGGTNEQRIFKSIWSYGSDLYYGKLAFMDKYGNIDLSFMDAQIAEALTNGDIERANWLRTLWEAELEKKKKKTDKIDGKIAEALARGNEDIHTAAIARENGDIATYQKLTGKLIAAGISEKYVDQATKKVMTIILKEMKKAGFADGDVDAATAELMDRGLNEDAARKTAEKLTEKKEKKEYSGIKYSYSDAFTALKTGDKESFDVAVNALVRQKMDEGKYTSEAAAKKYVLREIISTNRTDPLFEELEEAAVGNDSARNKKIWEQLKSVFGSEEIAKERYKSYRERKNK